MREEEKIRGVEGGRELGGWGGGAEVVSYLIFNAESTV